MRFEEAFYRLFASYIVIWLHAREKSCYVFKAVGRFSKNIEDEHKEYSCYEKIHLSEEARTRPAAEVFSY